MKQTKEEEELLKYKEFVKMLSDTSDDRIFLNKGEKHALIVLESIFRQSTENVRIFAGNLFRTVGNDAEYISALSNFIDKNGKVRILLNDFDENLAKKSNLYKRLSYFKRMGKDIIVKRTTARPYRESDSQKREVHFTIGDKRAYRIETDINQRTAQCSMNRPSVACPIADFYDTLFTDKQSTEINIIELLGYNE